MKCRRVYKLRFEFYHEKKEETNIIDSFVENLWLLQLWKVYRKLIENKLWYF